MEMSFLILVGFDFIIYDGWKTDKGLSVTESSSSNLSFRTKKIILHFPFGDLATFLLATFHVIEV